MLNMNRLALAVIVLVGCVGCGTMRTAQTIPANSLVASVAPQDTLNKAGIKTDSLREGSVKDSSLRNSSLHDSALNKDILKDSLLRDTVAIASDSNLVAVQEAPQPVRYYFSPVYQTDLHVPSSQAVPAGQYSGITYIGDNRYAVVHDKLNGGGIVFFDIVLSDKGKVSSAKATIPSFTTNSKISGRDNEGIAFVPGAESIEGTLFVSSESNQSIAEYTLDGKETGRHLAVPAAFAKDKITSNNGFEALTYNDVTKTFWTTTETPLKADGKDSRLLRLQSFGSNLKAGKQYLYKMDAPSKTAAEGSAAKAYVHGVPAMAALDDGSLIVLEREVYVPNGGLFAKALGSFTRTKLYVVTPGASTSATTSSSKSSTSAIASTSKISAAAKSGQVLEKKLFLTFTTSALNLANFEGMCLGPDLPGGWHTLILVADSQGGSNGLTAEYIKVILFK